MAAAEWERERRRARGRVQESREVRVVDAVLDAARLVRRRRRLSRSSGGTSGRHSLKTAPAPAVVEVTATARVVVGSACAAVTTSVDSVGPSRQ